MEKIKVLIADDEWAICDLIEKELKKYEDIEIVGIVKEKDEEIRAIDENKPDIVITDLLRNNEYVGYNIIKKYEEESYSPVFLLFTAAPPSIVFTKCKNVGGYIQKFGGKFDRIVVEIRRIKEEMENQREENPLQNENKDNNKNNFIEFIKRFLQV